MTPGQAAYEMFCELFPFESWGPWESLEHSDCDDRPGWEKIAGAAIAAKQEAGA